VGEDKHASGLIDGVADAARFRRPTAGPLYSPLIARIGLAVC
jgi:hypothetical protein